MAIKAFVFDCGGVLLGFGDPAAYSAWEARLGIKPGELAKALWEGEPWTLAERGRLSDAEFWQQVGRRLGVEDDQQIAALREDLWRTWVVNPKVLALVERLRAQYKVALLSNSTDALEEELARRYGVADRFETIVNSARVGTAKPERAIYEETLRRLGVAPAEAVFIDDRAENVAAAAALGMHVVWFINGDELERQLGIYIGQDGREKG